MVYNHNTTRGVAFDVGQTLSNFQRNRLRNTARSSGAWSYVEPASLTPTWVHFDKRSFPSACSSGGYPLIRQGSRGVYVLIAQDDLNTLGFRTGGLDRNIWGKDSGSSKKLSTFKRNSSRWNSRM